MDNIQREKSSDFQFLREESPIKNSLVLDLVFDFLDVQTLKSCRQVCIKWRDSGMRSMMSKSSVYIDGENKGKINEIISSMNSNSKFLFKNFTCDKITHSSYPNIWPLLGDHVKSFVVSHWWGDAKDLTLKDYEDLLLKRCPCLEELTLPATKHFRKAQNFLLCSLTAQGQESEDVKCEEPRIIQIKKKRQINLNLKTIKVIGDARPDVRFWRILSLSPKLKRLHIECQLVEEFWNPNLKGRPQWGERMSHLKELEIRSYANEGASETSVNYFTSIPWNLKSLTYECYDVSDTGMMACSDHLKDTLEYMHVVLFNKKYEPWPAGLKGDWMTSPKLTKLKHYKLTIDEQCQGPIFCRTLVLSIFIPVLESLTLAIYDDGENNSEWEQGLFETIYRDYMNAGAAEGQEVVKKDFKNLSLPPKMKDTSFILPIIKVYPNLNEVTLEIPSPQVVSLILLHWQKLQKLTLSLSLDCPDYFGINWNFVLTGLQITQGAEGEPLCFFNGASIINLKSLTSLDIHMVSTSTSIEGDSGVKSAGILLNDVFVYNGLGHLRAVQRVSVTGQEFSPEAVSFLRGILLPFCHLDLHRGSLKSSTQINL